MLQRLHSFRILARYAYELYVAPQGYSCVSLADLSDPERRELAELLQQVLVKSPIICGTFHFLT